MDYTVTSSEFTLDREEMKKFDFDTLKAKLLGVAENFAKAQEEMMLRRVSEAAHATGNIVSTKGEEFKPEHFFAMLRKILVDFDPETEIPRLPTLVIHSDQGFEELNRQWENDHKLKAERDQIMKEKLEEWRVRENLRKLVD